MNKNLYKTIINCNTGLIVVVAENKMAVFSVSGSLKNVFDAEKVQNEINLQVKVTKEFRSNVQDFQAKQNKRLDELKEKKEWGEISEQEYEEQAKKIERQKLITNVVAGGLLAPTDNILGIAVSSVSPAVSYAVGQHFKSQGKEGSFEHIATHAVLGALTANANGGNALSGAISAGGAEALAPIVAKVLYGKDNSQNLTADEKETVVAVTTAIGTLSGSVIGDSSANAYIGNTVASNAVENNYLTAKQLIEAEKAYLSCGDDEACKQRVIENAQYISGEQDKRLAWAKTKCGFGFCDDINTMNKAWVDSLNVGKVAQELQRQYPNISYEDALILAEKYSAEADSSFNKGSTRVIIGALNDLPALGLGGATMRTGGKAVTQTVAKQATKVGKELADSSFGRVLTNDPAKLPIVEATDKGFIAAGKITQESRIVNVPKEVGDVQRQIASAGTARLSGEMRETVSDAYFTQHGFTKLDGKCGAQCFDGVYIKHGEIYIVEVKPLSSKGTIQLSPNKGSNIGTQMSNEWIANRAEYLEKKGKNPEAKLTGEKVLSALKNGNVNKIVVGVNDKTMVTVNLGKGKLPHN